MIAKRTKNKRRIRVDPRRADTKTNERLASVERRVSKLEQGLADLRGGDVPVVYEVPPSGLAIGVRVEHAKVGAGTVVRNVGDNETVMRLDGSEDTVQVRNEKLRVIDAGRK